MVLARSADSLSGYEYRGEKPFSNVYFTGIVRDKIGRKMSKQLGNSPDPLDLIAKYPSVSTTDCISSIRLFRNARIIDSLLKIYGDEEFLI